MSRSRRNDQRNIPASCRCDHGHDYSLRGDARGGAIEVVS